MSFYFSYDAANLYDALEKNLSLTQLNEVYSKPELHCTMLYSNEEYQKEYNKLKFPPHQTEIEDISIWDTGERFVLVANLKKDGLIEKNKEIKDKFDFKVSQEFNPHITLQKFEREDELPNIKDFYFLIGTKVQLTGFRCIPIKNTNKIKPK